MSINITAAVPLDIVHAIREATRLDNNIEALAGVTSTTTKAVIEAVQALPYDIFPKVEGSKPLGTASTITAATCLTPISTHTMGKSDGMINLTVKYSEEEVFPITIAGTATGSDLGNIVQQRSGISIAEQRLVHAGKPLWNGHHDPRAESIFPGIATLEEVRISFFPIIENIC